MIYYNKSEGHCPGYFLHSSRDNEVKPPSTGIILAAVCRQHSTRWKASKLTLLIPGLQTLHRQWLTIADTDTSTDLSFATLHARMMIALMATSHGIMSALNSGRQCMERMTPLPAPTRSPVGPWRLSTHPGIGSLHVAVTRKKTPNWITVQQKVAVCFLCATVSRLCTLRLFWGLNTWKAKEERKYFYILSSPISGRACPFGRFPGFPLLSFW
jgi:hypothetical protein